MIEFDVKRTGKTITVQFAGAFEDAEKLIMKTLDESRAPLLQALGRYPSRPAIHPFQFATPKSRRYYFVLIREGKINTDGKRYVRTGGYRKSWVVDTIKGKGTYTLSVGNKWRANRFVGGALDFDESKARARQVAGHRRTGWQISAQVADAKFDEVIARIVKGLK